MYCAIWEINSQIIKMCVIILGPIVGGSPASEVGQGSDGGISEKLPAWFLCGVLRWNTYLLTATKMPKTRVLKHRVLERKRRPNALVARAIRNVIRANRFARIIRNWNPYFYSASGRFVRFTRISDSRESADSRESRESIRANHATKPNSNVSVLET